MAVTFSNKGNFAKLNRYLVNTNRVFRDIDFEKYGKLGVDYLYEATPKDTGLTAASWTYKIRKIQNGHVRIEFWNTNVKDGVPIALVIQYGHATKGGGYVEGIDYINPALQPLFDDLAKKAWEEVKSL